MRVRVDFDTTIGDVTYTSIKNTMPMIKEFSVALSQKMDLTMTTDIDIPDIQDVNSSPSGSTTEGVTENEEPLKTMRIFFPDMGAAALVR